MNYIELTPTDNRKSFYGKAVYTQNENGSRTLYSYETRIMTIHADGTITAHWNGWSKTTGRHINAFCGLNKKEYEKLVA